MVRHPALTPLSRSHHHALRIAKRLREATPASAADDARAFVEHWEGEERAHFRLEEELLLPAYAAHGSPEDPLIVRMLVEHVVIRGLAARIAEAPALELLHDLGHRLEAHVRFEEREAFAHIERTIPEDGLEALREPLLEAERALPRRAGR